MFVVSSRRLAKIVRSIKEASMHRRLGLFGVASAAVAAVLWAAVPSRGAERLKVHEWGTFTCLQDEQGRELPGINIDDEPVPDFVHNLAPFILSRPFLSNVHWQYRMKGAPRHHPQVTMRLETPVIYFYPPKGEHRPLDVDVRVRFRGGWLTEFFPQAEADTPGLRDGGFAFRDLKPSTVGSLEWNGVQVGTEGVGPQTNEHVWLAPRQVAAANVTAASGESERYLFYRGVGRQRAPLRLVREMDGGGLGVYSNFDDLLNRRETATIPSAWLVEVREGGENRFQTVGPFTVSGDPSVRLGSLAPQSLATSSEGGVDQLKAAMHACLVQQGLFDDEATAMLSTWNRAYFQSPGLRLFFVVPRPWVDHYLPLEISHPADIERVMIARIELVTDEQRALLAKLAKAEIGAPEWIERLPRNEASEKFLAGRIDFGDLGVEIPQEYQWYLRLGRFRNALVVAEEQARPTESLRRFVELYALTPFRAPPEDEAERSGLPDFDR